MELQGAKLAIAAMLHDIGKIVYRKGEDTRKHSISGYDFLRKTVGITDQKLLDCVRYHHAYALKDADIEDNAMAYIVYMADNIASATDRRETDEAASGFDVKTPLRPVFNLLNGNRGSKYYSPFILNETEGINYPTDKKSDFQKEDYNRILLDITDHLKGIEWKRTYIDSLLEVLEADLSYIPSATSKHEVPDISLFDHLKMTAAIAGCIYLYFQDKGVSNYREVLFSNSKKPYEEKCFLPYLTKLLIGRTDITAPGIIIASSAA